MRYISDQREFREAEEEVAQEKVAEEGEAEGGGGGDSDIGGAKVTQTEKG